MKLTRETINTIERGDSADRIVFDDQLKGFGLRLQGERQTWIVQYRVGVKQRRITLGSTSVLTADKARKAAQKTGQSQARWRSAAGQVRQARSGQSHTALGD